MSRAIVLGPRACGVLALTVLLGFVSTGSAGAHVVTVPTRAPAAGATAAGGTAVSGAAAAGWTEGSCPDTSGVTVAVDFRQLGGGTALRCAPGPVADGFDALGRAGIAFRTATRSPGFLCRIAGLPTTDPCIVPAPATAYWSYWLAARGGPWCYSNLGAGNRRPPPGTVEGWSFSLTSDGATAPPPRVAAPDPIPGVEPATLGAADCDSTPPATVPATSDAVDPTNQVPVPGLLPSGEPPAPSEADGAPPDTPDTPDAGAIAVSGVTTSIAPSTTAGSGELPGSTPDTSSGSVGIRTTGDTGPDSEEAGMVDLGDGGTTGPTSPVGVLSTVALIGALGAGAFLVRRRAAHH